MISMTFDNGARIIAKAIINVISLAEYTHSFGRQNKSKLFAKGEVNVRLFYVIRPLFCQVSSPRDFKEYTYKLESSYSGKINHN